MPYQATTVCVLCQSKSLSRALVSTTATQPWTAVRFASQAPRRRTPSRMTLSPSVAKPVPTPGGRDRRSSRPPNSPFGGMNVTSVRPSKYTNKPSRSQTSRSEHSKGPKAKSLEPKQRSEGTFKALKMQRTLAQVSYGQRNTVKEKIAESDSFNEFGLLPAVKEAIGAGALAGLEEIVPTPIQRVAIPAILNSKTSRKRSGTDGYPFDQFLMAAETGSGKTLGYLAPVVDAVKRADAADAEREAERELNGKQQKIDNPNYVKPPPLTTEPHVTTGRPRAIVLLPSAELVTQVTSVLKQLSHLVKFRSAGISAAVSPNVVRKRLFSPSGIDILVTTPHLLDSITTSDPYVLSRVTHMVVDEADSLLDRSFAPITTSVVDKCASSLRQLILCSATIPRALDNFLRARFPDMRRLTTPNLHAIPRRVQLGVVDVVKDPYRNNKNLACADTLYTIGKSANTEADDGADASTVKRVMVFVNEREKTEELADYLRTKGINAQALHRDTEKSKHSEILEDFTSSVPIVADAGSSSPQPRSGKVGRSLPNVKVLVTTDLGSRGIDTVAVRHVILYDVPHSTIDFIHRLGRTGRMGRRGRGIILVGRGDRRDVVKEVRQGMFRGQALI